MPATAPTGVGRDGKPAVKIRIIEEVTRNVIENVTRVDNGTRYTDPAAQAAEHQRQLSLATSGAHDMATTPAAGGGHGSGGAGWLGKAAAVVVLIIVFLIAVNHFPLNASMRLGAGPASGPGVSNGFSGISGARPSLGLPGGGYVAGAPRNARECVARGGTNTGRGCDGYN
jgi:hypothetical protein